MATWKRWGKAHRDERCTLSRSACRDRASGSAEVADAWRPLGLLMAFLETGGTKDDKAQHKEKTFLNDLAGPDQRQFRYDCRQVLEGTPGAQSLMAEKKASLFAGLEPEPRSLR